AVAAVHGRSSSARCSQLLSFQLFVTSKNLGSLNLYGEEPGLFDKESTLVGELFAQHASVALIGAATTSKPKLRQRG
ncbi:MAG TPA: hypothetical protein VEX40_12005, partial [Mycobacterium sp.]|nr:hypothetical protein [Mycobacterium sp.]